MLVFEYYVIVKQGFKPVMETETVNEFRFYITANCRATADRMIKTLYGDNIKDISGVCLGSSDELLNFSID